MRRMLVLAGALALAGCYSQETADEHRRALEAYGFTDIHLHSVAPYWNGCDEKDYFASRFTAKGPTGVSVSGVVCSSVLKGATVRFK